MKTYMSKKTLTTTVFTLLLSICIMISCATPCTAKSKPLKKLGHFIGNIFEPITNIPRKAVGEFFTAMFEGMFDGMFSGFLFPGEVFVHLLETQYQYKTALVQNIRDTDIPAKPDQAPLIPDCSSAEAYDETCGVTIYTNGARGSSISGMPAIREIIAESGGGKIKVRLVTDQDVSAGEDANGNLLAYGIILIKDNEPYVIMYCGKCTHKPGVYPRKFILFPDGLMKDFKDRVARVYESANTIEFTIPIETIPALESGEFAVSGGVQAFSLEPNGDLVPSANVLTPFVWTGKSDS